MAIAQEITIIESGLSFLDWVDSLTGDAKTAALAAVADRDAKFEAQLAAGNVYISNTGKRVWVSLETEQVHMDEVGQAYADLWIQWAEETGGSLTINFDDTLLDEDKVMPFAGWARANLSSTDYTTFVSQSTEISAAVAAAVTEGKATENEGSYTVTDVAFHDELKAAYPLFKSTREAYESYLATL